MWQRQTFYECADELEALSREFRRADSGEFPASAAEQHEVMLQTSERALEVLRSLSLAIRSEEDYGMTMTGGRVGLKKRMVSERAATQFIEEYRPPYTAHQDASALSLRQALNKIAHAHPTNTDYRAGASFHELLVCDSNGTEHSVTVISILDLCSAIKHLPDRLVSANVRNLA